MTPIQKVINFEAMELKKLRKSKKQLMTDENATISDNTKSMAIIIELAEKYGVDTQTIWDNIKD